jgi:hypothetical protein
MKKIFAIIGGVVTAASIVTVIVIILKKIKLSFSIESVDDALELDDNLDMGDDISVTVEDTDEDEEDIGDISF